MNESIVCWLNELATDAVRQQFRKCCGATWWCDQMTQARPFADFAALAAEADRVFDTMTREAWLEAFGSHPKIGDLKSLRMRLTGNKQWSEGEQSGVTSTDEATLVGLAEGNRAYEERFGYVFIICATGLAATEMLAQLKVRLRNDDATEFRQASEQQRKITHLRLKKLTPSA
ncbi:MAG: 2-oxo-4-hydroxy-4-carboxy-5-ureidoimidazoline decarboxylase [Planctomycetes bacterium]|nr:2-oxo-4-hydroxy-4-carboxy-5-ureidoimidazoline decarboxylase [Planctomycetota bacterium]